MLYIGKRERKYNFTGKEILSYHKYHPRKTERNDPVIHGA